MTHHRALSATLALLVSVLSAPALCAGGTPIATMPVDEIRPGMTAMAHTVFIGADIDSFPMRILGVLRNVTPGGDLILARAEGDSLERMGIVQGMSGSPVYIDGRMIGALAYGWEFSRAPITGITPIGEMLSLLDKDRLPKRLRGEDDGKGGAEQDPIERLRGGPGERRPEALPPDAGEPRPLVTPVMVSGVAPAALEILREPFARHRLALTAGGGAGNTGAAGERDVSAAGSRDAAAPAPLVPGSAVGVILARGDASIAGIGTVTWRDGDRLLAFGHPLFQSGDVDLPMTAAWVHATIPLATRSFKMATALEPVGLITGDRATGIVGRMGLEPDLIPFSVTVGREGSKPRRFEYQLVRDREFTPLLVSALSLSSMTAGEALSEESLLDVEMQVDLAGGRTVTMRDRFSSAVPPVSLAQGVANPLELLMQNPFQAPGVSAVRLAVTRGERGRYAWIDHARIEDPLVEPGDTVSVAVELRPYRGNAVTRRVRVPLPPSIREGDLVVRVADADSAATWDFQRAPATYSADSFDRLVELLETARSHDGFYVQVVRARGGRVVEGREFPALPGTVASIMRPGNETSALRPTRMDVVREVRVPEAFQVIGSRELPLRVSPRGTAMRRTR